MFRKYVSITLSIVAVITLSMFATEPVKANVSLTDIGQSDYREAIEELAAMGIVTGSPDGRFEPDKPLAKAEAAAMISRALHISPIATLDRTSPDMEKSFTYEEPLQVIDDSFSIPSAEDIEGHWALAYIEGMLKIKSDSVANRGYEPEALLTKSQWTEMLGRTVLGGEQELDFQQKMVDLQLVSAELAHSGELITKGEAAQSLQAIVTNPDFTVVTVFATADIHAHLEPYLPNGAQNEIGSLAKMNKIIKKMRDQQPNVLLLDAGDAPYNTNIGNLTEGAATIAAMNEMQYDAMVLGNHDFDFPFEVLQRNAGAANFPFLSANTLYHNEHPEFLEPFVIREVGGIKIGIIGVTDDQSAYYTHPKNVEGITFIDHFEAAQQAIEEIRDEVDLVITLAHLHRDNEVLPQVVNGIDIEIGGGEDVVDFPRKINDTWLIAPGKHAETLNQINIQFLDGEMIGMNFAHLFLTHNLEEDDAVSDIIAGYRQQIDAKMQEVVGVTLSDLDGERQTVRFKESNLANAIADSLIELTGADIALQNGGGVRTSIQAGEITLEDIYGVLPFDNTVVMVEASGQTIWDALEHGVSVYPAGAFLQVSGLSYTFDLAQDPGSRIVEVTVDGAPIELDRMYKVAANDFLTGGGDKFDMLKDDTKELLRTKHFLRDAFTEYLATHKTINPQLEGRIQVMNPDAVQTE